MKAVFGYGISQPFPAKSIADTIPHNLIKIRSFIQLMPTRAVHMQCLKNDLRHAP